MEVLSLFLVLSLFFSQCQLFVVSTLVQFEESGTGSGSGSGFEGGQFEVDQTPRSSPQDDDSVSMFVILPLLGVCLFFLMAIVVLLRRERGRA